MLLPNPDTIKKFNLSIHPDKLVLQLLKSVGFGLQVS